MAGGTSRSRSPAPTPASTWPPSAGRLVDAIAPCPLLVVHARGDEVIPFENGPRLLEHASQPKIRFWVGTSDKHGHFFDRQGNQADHNSVIYNNDAAKAVHLFFEAAEPML